MGVEGLSVPPAPPPPPPQHPKAAAAKAAADVDMGDMVAKDSGQLGRDLYHKGTGKKLTWFNQGSELALRDELNQKYPHGHESANVLLGLRKKASLPAQTKFVNSPGAIGSQTNAPDRVDVMFGIAKRKRIGAGSPVHSLYELILPS